MAENWTDLAPPPPSLAQGKTWHLFVSYRSVNRPWVLALYDILNGLGYKVFLDQYVLTAAAPLAISLGEAWTRARALFSFGRVSRRTLNGSKLSSRLWR